MGVAVSVVLPVRDAGAHVAAAVASILGQTFTDFELLVVDDGSRDETASVLRAFTGDQRLRVLTSPVNRGLVPSLNLAIREARAPLIARMDADDVAHPHRLAVQAAHLRAHPEVGLLGSSYRRIAPGGAAGHVVRLDAPDIVLRWRLLFENPFAHPTVVFRRTWFDRAGGYRESAFPAEDYDLWIRMARLGPIANLADVLLDYCLSETGITASRLDEQLTIARRLAAEQVQALVGAPVAPETVATLRSGSFASCTELARGVTLVGAARRALERSATPADASLLRAEVARSLHRIDRSHGGGAPCPRCRLRLLRADPAVVDRVLRRLPLTRR